MQTGAPLYNKDKISLIAKKKKTALPTWKNLDGWTLNKQFFLFGLIQRIMEYKCRFLEVWNILGLEFLLFVCLFVVVFYKKIPAQKNNKKRKQFALQSSI